MRKTSLANAKAHLSELVDAAEHRGQRILILRHGKPAAAIVPAKVVAPLATPLSAAQAKALLDRLTSSAPVEPLESIEEALGRRRLERTK
jgi:prevent-host-death family protein